MNKRISEDKQREGWEGNVHTRWRGFETGETYFFNYFKDHSGLITLSPIAHKENI